MGPELTRRDAGKPVVDANGDRLGRIETVSDGVARVVPAADVPRFVSLALGWERDRPPHDLGSRFVASSTDHAVYLRGNL